MAIERALMWFCGDEIIIEDWVPEFFLYSFGFSGDLVVYVDITIDDLYFFTRQAYESFDVVFTGVGGIFENNYVPSFWFEELVDCFNDDDGVAA